MAAVTASPYGAFLLALGKAQINLETVSFKIALTGTGYTPDVNAHDFFNDITGQVTGTGYTAGGKALTGITWTYDTANRQAVLGAATVTWTGVTITAHFAIVYIDTGTPTTSPLVGYIDFGEDRAYTGTDFPISFPNGVLRLRVT